MSLGLRSESKGDAAADFIAGEIDGAESREIPVEFGLGISVAAFKEKAPFEAEGDIDAGETQCLPGGAVCTIGCEDHREISGTEVDERSFFAQLPQQV